MKIKHLFLTAALVTAASGASIAQQDAGASGDAGAAKLTIPPRVSETDLPAFDAEPFPTEKSKPPTVAEWTGAPRVRITRMYKGAGCVAKRVREWMKIRCESSNIAGLRLIAGSTDGVALWVPEPLTGDEQLFTTISRFSEIIFPVRQGDRRILEAIRVEFGEWEGWGASTTLLIEEEWLPGGAPQIAVLPR